MGADKAAIDLGGMTIARRAARALAVVARPVLAVGEEAGTGLEVVADPRRGPLAAFVAGAEALAARAADGPILLVACDLPFASAALLGFLARVQRDEDAQAVVPVAGDRDQSLCACYGPDALGVARDLVASGRDAMRDMLAALAVRRVAEDEWARLAPPEALLDVDSPQDLAAARRVLDEPGGHPSAR